MPVIIGAISVGLFEGTTLTLEYFHDEDYDVEDNGSEDGGTGEDKYGFTAQLAYEF